MPDALAAVLEAFAAGSLSDAAACFAVGGTYREPRNEPIRGRAAIAEHFARFAASGIAWSFVVDDVIQDATRACVLYRFRVGEGTGEPQRERAGCALVRYDEIGQILEWREYEG